MMLCSKMVWAGAAMVIAAVAVSAQAAQQVDPKSARGSGASAAAHRGADREILREIQDPATGQHWLLERQADRLGGPGKLVLAGAALQSGETAGRTNSGGPGAAGRNGSVPAVAAAPLPPVIRAGDRLMLVAHTAVMDAALEAVALAPAQVGSSFPVRLRIGGRVMRAVALGAGRAQWSTERGERN